MAVSALEIEATLIPAPDFIRRLRKMNPGLNRRIASKGLTECMLLTLRNAARKGIYPGGDGAPRPDILTSRTGTLRRSLSPRFALDRSGLPRYIEGGTQLIYGAVHEFGTNGVPRPFLARGLQMSIRSFEQIFINWWDREGLA